MVNDGCISGKWLYQKMVRARWSTVLETRFRLLSTGLEVNQARHSTCERPKPVAKWRNKQMFPRCVPLLRHVQTKRGCWAHVSGAHKAPPAKQPSGIFPSKRRQTLQFHFGPRFLNWKLLPWWLSIGVLLSHNHKTPPSKWLLGEPSQALPLVRCFVMSAGCNHGQLPTGTSNWSSNASWSFRLQLIICRAWCA